QVDIIAFLKTLNDVQFLFNKDNLFPKDKGNNP
ncbi:MAG: hypothetical protein RLZZ60_1282, partial [Bacteroidota bacterium]